jgi:hypothetical protein
MPTITKPTLRTLSLAAAAVLATTFAATPASAALNAFLKIGGTPAPHASSAARGGHKDWIEVSSWSWGTSNARKGWDGTIKGRREAAAPSISDTAPPVPAPSPGGAGTLRVKVRFPWTDCRVGAAFPGATLDDAAASYAFSEVVVTRCDPDAVTLSYAKVTVRGWDPAKKEE